MDLKLFFIIIAFLWSYEFTDASLFNVVLTRAECDQDPTYLCSGTKCYRTSRYNTTTSIFCHLDTPQKKIYLTFTLNIKRNFAYKYFLVKKTENMCDVEDGYPSNPLMDLIVEPLRKYSNLIQKCPYKIGNLSMVNVPPHSLQYPPFLPAGEYRVDIRLFNERNLTILSYRLFGTVVPKGIDQLLSG